MPALRLWERGREGTWDGRAGMVEDMVAVSVELH
jgi:hypothetical protein